MFENSILPELHVPDFNPVFLRDVCTFQDRYGLGAVATRLYILMAQDLENLVPFSNFLLVPKVFQKDMQVLEAVLSLPDLSSEGAVKVAVYKCGRVPTAQALMVELAQDRVMNGYAPAALDIIQNWDIPNFPVTGEELMKQGYKPGPELGKKLRQLEDDWIARGFAS